MDLLLDTHVLLWWDQEIDLLNPQVGALIADPDNRVFVSAVSPWEIAIKARLGRIEFEGSSVALIERNHFAPLFVTPEHGEAAGTLDWAHADPFDRMLVAQAQIERLTLVHADAEIRKFDFVSQLWARR